MKMMRTAGVALLLVTGFAYAEDIAWVGTISLDGRATVDIVDTTEAGCNAQVAAYRDVVVIESCRPVSPSAITDDNDHNRRRRNPGNVQPNPGSDGGSAAGAGRALGGVGNIGGSP
jgi:hypothetical protein